ncbi:MAG: hypothetical protein AAB437_00200 [Patescibacteria group bacterium]
MINNVSGGIQVDINAVTKKLPNDHFSDAALCDHNCRTFTGGQETGHYDCPASFTVNKGVNIQTLSPADLLLKGIQIAAEGVRQFNQMFLESGFDDYTKRFNINKGIEKDIFEQTLKSPKVEVNCFGGNPELHPKILEIIRGLDGFAVNLTTTGGIFMRDEKFPEKLLVSPPEIIALSADDFENADHIKTLSQLRLDQLKTQRNDIPAIYGQKRKAHEAIYVAKLAQRFSQFPQILFNLVVHEGNILYIEEIITTLRTIFPGVIVNPYPAQSSFSYSSPVFNEDHLQTFEEFIDRRIEEHLEHKTGIVPRLHYWLLLKSIFETYRENSPEISRQISGYNTWKCYKTPGADRYIQIGTSPQEHDGKKTAGGHLNCFWNSKTIVDSKQVWDSEPEYIANYLARGLQGLASHVPTPCPGCLMPRLTFDEISLELGMNESLIPSYLNLRNQTAGF